MKFRIPSKVTTTVSAVALQAQKTSPKALFVGGVIGVVATTVLASRATLRLGDVLDEAKETLEKIETVEHPDYSAEDKVKDKALLRLKTFVKIGKLYLPALAVGSLSIAALTGSHVILTKRNAALTAAYATIQKTFAEYRERVIEAHGVDEDRRIRYGVKTSNVTEVDETGKKTQVEKTHGTGVSGYGRLFHEGNANWNPAPEYNVIFLRAQQNYMNDRLQAKGFVLLNDVYDALGFDRTTAGSVVGWTRYGGDGVVDFGIFHDEDLERVRDYAQGLEGEIYLDFNVDGVVYDQIDKIRS